MRQLRRSALILVLVLAAVSSTEPLRACVTDSGCPPKFHCCGCQCIVGFCDPAVACPDTGFALSAAGVTAAQDETSGPEVSAPRLDTFLQSLRTESQRPQPEPPSRDLCME